MRKYLLLIFLITCTTFAFGQNEHFKFLDIPIDGTLTEISKKFENKGFVNVYEKDDFIGFKGDYLDYEDCTISIFACHPDSAVIRVDVSLPDKSTWSDLYQDYNKMKKFFILKYGQPTECIENVPDKSLSDTFKMLEVKKGNCDYYTNFIMEDGVIVVKINKGVHIAYVSVTYFDKANCENCNK